ncbi:MAG TPA: alpha/beta fold hydrolase [Propionibacterium sp.]|jgi:pimeloyl-ACP methyl ester carboxylesterase|nr:alpha/beta fold hydrolase [Propionibacterium sp.]
MTTHVERGFGESLVFIPPLGGTAALFADQLQEFSRDFRTITVTLLGNGDTGPLDVDTPDIIGLHAGDIVNLLGDLEVRRAHIVGVGYGGAVAQRFAIDHPASVRRLVLCDTWGDTTARTPVEKALALTIRSSSLAYRAFPRSILAAATLNSYLRWPAAGRVLAEQMRSARIGELRAQFRAYTHLNHATELRALTCPTLCLAGDTAPWLVTLARRLAMTIPDARLEVIKNAFEPSHLTQPALFNEAVRRFLTRPTD